MVCPLITTEEAAEPSEMVFVPTVTAESAGCRICEPMTNCEMLFSVYTVPPTVMAGAVLAGPGAAIAKVCPLIMTIEPVGASERV